jgi:5-methylcytosine-specific restriction protein B
LILYGPPGTGKTYHATKIATKLVLKNKIKPNNVKKISVEQKIAQIMLENNGLALDLEEIVNKIIENEPNRDTSELLLHVQNILNGDDMVGKENLFYKKYGDKKYGLNLPFEIKQSFRFVLFANNAPMYQQAIVDECKKREILPPEWNWNNKIGDVEFVNDKDLKERSNFIFTDDKYSLRNCNYFEDALNVKNTFIKKVTFHPSYSYEDFVEGFRPNVKGTEKTPYKLEHGIFKQICNDAKHDDPKNKYVIIIDEINRGNIPKILGELITLIEKDKRNPQNSLKLTYSKDSFFVPKNLIIIGTMNTADKSLMQMDDALKRRFVFEELMPNTKLLLDHLEENNVTNAKDYSDILDRINEKILGKGNKDEIERTKQFRDRQIGHSYFWDIHKDGKSDSDDDLQKIIKYDVIPLLQDYFYGDYTEIRKILGKDYDGKDTSIIGDDNRPSELVNDLSKKEDLRKTLLKI